MKKMKTKMKKMKKNKILISSPWLVEIYLKLFIIVLYCFIPFYPGTQMTPVLIGKKAFFWRVVSPKKIEDKQVVGLCIYYIYCIIY